MLHHLGLKKISRVTQEKRMVSKRLTKRLRSVCNKMRKILPRTVNGPSPERVSAKPAAVTAATRVLKKPAPTAISTIVFLPSWPLAKAAHAVKTARVNLEANMLR